MDMTAFLAAGFADRAMVVGAIEVNRNAIAEVVARGRANRATEAENDAVRPGHALQRSAETEPQLPAEQSIRPLAERLRTLLGINLTPMATLVIELRNLHSALNIDDRERFALILRDETTNRWVRTPESALLLVNAGGQTEMLRSATAAVCSTMVRSFVRERRPDGVPTIVLFHFCNDERLALYYGPEGMLCVLIAHLISSHEVFDYDFVATSWPSVNRGNIDSLCEFFVGLVRRLPADTWLYILVDGLSCYEDDRRKERTLRFMAAITMMVRLGTQAAVVKFLVTSPVRFNEVQRYFQDSEIMNIISRRRDGPGRMGSVVERR